MNERIRELLSQAGVHYEVMPADTVYEKFAELIVMECYEHCNGEMIDKKLAEEAGLNYNDGVMDCAIGLLQHFGVE